jgi:hypothetical protein
MLEARDAHGALCSGVAAPPRRSGDDDGGGALIDPWTRAHCLAGDADAVHPRLGARLEQGPPAIRMRREVVFDADTGGLMLRARLVRRSWTPGLTTLGRVSRRRWTDGVGAPGRGCAAWFQPADVLAAGYELLAGQ